MMEPAPIRRPAHSSENGYVLLAVLFLVVLLTISLAIALPKVTKQIQRDREIETMHRGKQYARAVKLYYKKFGAYPPNVDALVKGVNNIRFLRKKYTDPMTGKDDWKPVLFGQNKAPLAMGFFGKPLAGAAIAGTGPGSVNGAGGASSTGGSSFFASNDSPTSTNSSTGASASSFNSFGSTTSGTGGSSGDSGSSSGSSTGLSGQTFGGVGIIGFSPGSPKQSILVYKTKNHYNQWEFVYDPLADQMMQGSNLGTSGTPGSSTTSPSGGTTGSSTTDFFGGTTSNATSSFPSTTTTTPQQ
jgi:type II secretory pathway pseudopilin PulG